MQYTRDTAIAKLLESYRAYFNIIMQSVLVYTEKFTFFELLPITHIFYVVGIITIIIL